MPLVETSGNTLTTPNRAPRRVLLLWSGRAYTTTKIATLMPTPPVARRRRGVGLSRLATAAAGVSAVL